MRRAFSAFIVTMLVVGLPVVGQEAGGDEPEYALEKDLAAESLLLDGIAVEGLLAAVGERGHILISRDQGESWQQAKVPTRRALTGVFFLDASLGWAVGHDAVILRTRDGGATWELLNYAPEEQRPFLDIWFADESNGIAIGAYGFFYRTSDGGDTWDDVGLELIDDAEGSEEDQGYDDYSYDYGADLHLNQVAWAGDGRFYIAAEAGTVYRSDDGGETWISLPSPYDGSFFGTLPMDGDSLLLYGLRGHLFRSDDAGDSWQELESGTEALLTDAVRLEDGTIVVSGLAGTLLVSTDGGQSFTLRQQEDRQGLTTVMPGSEGDLVLLGEFGVTRRPTAEVTGGVAP